VTLWAIVRKNIAQRALSSTLTAASIALGVAVVVAVLALKEEGREGFRQGAFGYDLVVGVKGSPLQLVLSTVYHLDAPPENIPYALYERLKADRRVRLAVPLALGDFHEGHRLVGTSDVLFRDFEVQAGRKFELAEGRIFRFDEEKLKHVLGAPPDHDPAGEGGVFEAVIGSRVAGLRPGSTFAARHGGDEGDAHEEKWTVVGVLKPTGTANDRAIFINLESFYHIKTHVAEEVNRGKISAVLLQTRGPRAAKDLAWELGKGAEAMGVVPAEEVARLFQIIGKVDVLLLAVSALVILVAAVSILVSIYNSMAERRRAIAIMRALGARRTTVLSIVILEAASLCLLGGLAGLVLGHVFTAVSAQVLAARAGVSIQPFAFRADELLVLAGVVALGALSGIVPALRAYRTDIADGLGPTS
jgi:putative ABC transport system permease protein